MEYAASAIGIDKEQQELARQAGHNLKEAAKDVYEGVKSAASGESTTTTTTSSHDSAESEQQGTTLLSAHEHLKVLISSFEYRQGGETKPNPTNNDLKEKVKWVSTLDCYHEKNQNCRAPGGWKRLRQAAHS